MISFALRQGILAAYTLGLTKTYEETAEIFAVGPATVSRLLRRYRETGDVQSRPVGGNHPRKVDLDWLRKHAKQQPDARLIDRIAAWKEAGHTHQKTKNIKDFNDRLAIVRDE